VTQSCRYMQYINIVQHCVTCILLYCVFYYVCEGDTDEDILPYPAPTVRQKKATKGPLKYFVLTSKEAHAAKLQQQQDKLQREKEKMKRTKLRAENTIKRAAVKKEKTAAAEERKLKRTIPSKNGKTSKRVCLTDAAATGLPAETSFLVRHSTVTVKPAICRTVCNRASCRQQFYEIVSRS